MDASAKARPQAKKISYALLITALSPLLPQILGSAFNIWYNIIIVDPLLTTAALKQRFLEDGYCLQQHLLSGCGVSLVTFGLFSSSGADENRTWRADLGAHAAGGAATCHSFAISWRDHLRLSLAALHTGLYFFTCTGEPRFGFATALALAGFLWSIWFHPSPSTTLASTRQVSTVQGLMPSVLRKRLRMLRT